MTLAWTFLAQRGYRPVRPGEAPPDAPTTWCLRELYLQHYGFAILDEATVQVLAPYAPSSKSAPARATGPTSCARPAWRWWRRTRAPGAITS